MGYRWSCSSNPWLRGRWIFAIPFILRLGDITTRRAFRIS